MALSFGDFELDQERRQLLRSGRPVSLEPKAYELLSLLVERRPRALSRAQIRDVVWPGVFISESTLGVVVNSIRQALDDDARQPQFIRTVHGFGYAFCGEARADEDEDGQSEGVGEALHVHFPAIRPVVDEAERRGADEGAGTAAAPRALPWVAAGALAVAVASAAWWSLSRPAPEEAPARPLKITPLTTDGGFKEWPQLSPDGEKVAYSWAGPDGGNWDVYVKAVGNGTWPLRLTEHPANDWSPVWSPDGRQIAFLRELEKGSRVHRAFPGWAGAKAGQRERSARPLQLSPGPVLVTRRQVARLRREAFGGPAGPHRPALAGDAGEGATHHSA
jgi:DNA-binding winged helix-turn-helix (wHTH) protein